MTRIISLLSSPLAIKIGLSVILLAGIWNWHASAIRNAKQQQAAETRSEVLNENNAQHEVEKQKYEERISVLEKTIIGFATRRTESTQRTELITKKAETERNEIPSLDDNARRLAIRARLIRPATTTP